MGAGCGFVAVEMHQPLSRLLLHTVHARLHRRNMFRVVHHACRHFLRCPGMHGVHHYERICRFEINDVAVGVCIVEIVIQPRLNDLSACKLMEEQLFRAHRQIIADIFSIFQKAVFPEHPPVAHHQTVVVKVCTVMAVRGKAVPVAAVPQQHRTARAQRTDGLLIRVPMMRLFRMDGDGIL